MSALAPAMAEMSRVPADLGRFRWAVDRSTASWSNSLYELYGYAAGEAEPSTRLAFAHKHPDDLHGCVDALHAGLLADRLVVHEHRLLDVRGRVRPVVMIARGCRDQRGRVQSVHGFLLALDAPATPAPDDVAEAAAVALTGALRRTFGVGDAAARVLLAARHVPGSSGRGAATTDGSTGRRSQLSGGDLDGGLRRSMADAMFPLEHLQGAV